MFICKFKKLISGGCKVRLLMDDTLISMTALQLDDGNFLCQIYEDLTSCISLGSNSSASTYTNRGISSVHKI